MFEKISIKIYQILAITQCREHIYIQANIEGWRAVVAVSKKEAHLKFKQ